MRAVPAATGEQSAQLRPMRAALAKMAAVLRAVVAVTAVAAALLGAEKAVSWWWLIPGLAVVACWASLYVTVAWTRGLRPWLIGADLLLTAALCLAIGHLVPAAALPGTTRLTKPSGEAISVHTVKQYIDRARAKFAAAGRPCKSNFALLARCIEDGLIRPGEITDYTPLKPGRIAS